MKINKLWMSIGSLAVLGLIAMFAINTSAAPVSAVTISAGSEPQRTGPPWLDEAWHYRRHIIINNSGALLPWYQVLIALDDENFPSFNLAKPDGSDVRFTHSDGQTPLSHWIESWNSASQRAYVWVKVPSLAMGDTTIYFYYGNPSAVSNSNGSGTFDYFDDDWSDFDLAKSAQSEVVPQDGNELLSPFTWPTIYGNPQVIPPGYLSLAPEAGIGSTNISLPRAAGFRANFGLNGVFQRAGFIDTNTDQGTMVGDDCPALPEDMFLINDNNIDTQCTAFSPNGSWHNAFHVYEVRWRSGQTFGTIDHGISTASSSSNVPVGPLPVTLYSYPGSGATLRVDWAYGRQYRFPEPTITALGDEQSLVDLAVTLEDSPDPLPAGAELTYQITVHNNSLIDASGVIITDTLPANVTFVSSIPASCSHTVDQVVCDLNIIPANSTASATIVVKPDIDGLITNRVSVDSPGYELDEDLGDNASQAISLVDSVPPNVNWESPAHNGEKYTTRGGLVTLIASAADNDQVVWVEFWYWDHIPPTGKVTIGKDSSYPYQWQFNSDVLMPDETYQVFLQAADRAGNISSIYTDPKPVIYIERILVNYLFLPFAIR